MDELTAILKSDKDTSLAMKIISSKVILKELSDDEISRVFELLTNGGVYRRPETKLGRPPKSKNDDITPGQLLEIADKYEVLISRNLSAVERNRQIREIVDGKYNENTSKLVKKALAYKKKIKEQDEMIFRVLESSLPIIEDKANSVDEIMAISLQLKLMFEQMREIDSVLFEKLIQKLASPDNN